MGARVAWGWLALQTMNDKEKKERTVHDLSRTGRNAPVESRPMNLEGREGGVEERGWRKRERKRIKAGGG